MPDKKNRNHNGKNGNSKGEALNFSRIRQVDLPQGRRGKHRELVSKILADLERTSADAAVRIPLNGLDGQKMQNVRSALNRVTRARKIDVATSADDSYLYVWRKSQ